MVPGDYNQRLPRRYTPTPVYDELKVAFPAHLRCATEGLVEPVRKASIDHLHNSLGLKVVELELTRFCGHPEA